MLLVNELKGSEPPGCHSPVPLGAHASDLADDGLCEVGRHGAACAPSNDWLSADAGRAEAGRCLGSGGPSRERAVADCGREVGGLLAGQAGRVEYKPPASVVARIRCAEIGSIEMSLRVGGLAFESAQVAKRRWSRWLRGGDYQRTAAPREKRTPAQIESELNDAIEATR